MVPAENYRLRRVSSNSARKRSALERRSARTYAPGCRGVPPSTIISSGDWLTTEAHPGYRYGAIQRHHRRCVEPNSWFRINQGSPPYRAINRWLQRQWVLMVEQDQVVRFIHGRRPHQLASPLFRLSLGPWNLQAGLTQTIHQTFDKVGEVPL